MAARGDIVTSLIYLSRDVDHETEKPYILQYKPDDETLPRTNCSRQIDSNILIKDLRGFEHEFSVEKQGFEFMRLNSSMQYADFDSEQMIKHVYYRELTALMQSRFNPRRIEILENIVRKRHHAFPVSTGKDYNYQQPTSAVHIDFTATASLDLANWKFGISPDEYTRIQMVNIWKPLQGPLMDWPLALCDASTVDPDIDLIACDVVGRTVYTENQQVYHNPKQEWYYLSGQLPSELVLFLQSDTSTDYRNGTPHAGFKHPKTTPDDDPRESIEVRFFLFY